MAIPEESAVVDAKIAQVAHSEKRIDEIDTLRLQKLMHHANSLTQQGIELRRRAMEVQAEARRKYEEFQALVKDVKARYELGPEHDIDLTDDNGGLVTVREG